MVSKSSKGKTALSTYLEEIDELGVPVLGWLGMYTVSKADIDYDDFVAAIDKYEAPLKPPRRPVLGDIFRRACSEAERRKVPTENTNEFINYAVKNISNDPDSIYKMLVAEIVDQNDKRLGHQNLTRIVFDKEEGSITFEPPEEDNSTGGPDLTRHPSYATICEFIENYINEKANILSTIQIRLSITDAFETALNGIPARSSGGIYFINSQYAEQLQAVEATINSFDAMSVSTVPLLDHRKHREMIKDAFEDEHLGEATKLLVELKELSEQPNPSGRRFTDLRVRQAELTSKMKEYQEVLGDSLTKSTHALKLTEALILTILEKSFD